MIEIENLSFKYKKNAEFILKSLNFKFTDNKIYFITGNNGAGKTTLIRLLMKLLTPTEGNIQYEENIRISYLPDFNGLYDDLSIIDNIKFRLAIYNIQFNEKENDFFELLKTYNLCSLEKKKVSELSLGMKKKVALIATLLVDADVYVLDEPTGDIDFHSKKEIVKMLNEFHKENKIVICITHEKYLVENVEAEILNLEDGVLE